MSLILSNAFKELLLSSYVNIKYDLAVKSFEDLNNKLNIEIHHSANDEVTLEFMKRNSESPEISKLEKRIFKDRTLIEHVITNTRALAKFHAGQAVILCHSYDCEMFKVMNPHLKLIHSDDHKIHSFAILKVSKSLSHSLQIYKL